MTTRLFLITVLMLLVSILKAQYLSSGQLISLMEELAGNEEGEINASSLSQEISDLIRSPVYINEADETELNRLFFLSPFQVKSIIDYRYRYGKLLSLEELRYIQGFNNKTIKLLKQFVTTGGPENYTRPSSAGGLILNYLYKTPSQSASTTGNNDKVLAKINWQDKQFSAGIVAEKDRGEPFIGAYYLPDYVSANFRYRGKGRIREIIIGDYKAAFGQGLSIMNGYSRPASPFSTGIMEGSSRITPNNSAGENDFMRGTALTSRLGKTNILAFLSSNRRDATMIGSDSTLYIRSFYPSGQHDTQNNMLKKDAAGISTAGISFNRNFRKYYLGLSYVTSRLSEPYYKENDTRSLYDFEGNTNNVISLENALLLKQAYLFGEYATNTDGGYAIIQGLGLSPGGRINLKLLWTHRSRRFTSFHGKSGGEELFNNPGNTLLAILGGELTGNLSFTSGLVYHRDLWYNNISGDFPSGYKSGLRLSFDPDSNYKLDLEFKQRRSDNWLAADQGIRIREISTTNNYRINLELIITEHLRFKSRFEASIQQGSEERGYIFYERAEYRFINPDLRVIVRVSVFRTTNWDSRIYSWEDDLLYNPVISAFYGQGSNTYIMMVLRATSYLTLRAKFSSVSIIDIRNTNEIKLQAIYNF